MACSCQKAAIGRKKKSMAKKRKSTRRRSIRGLNSKDMGSIATSAIVGGGGAVVVKMILDKVLPAEYTQYTHYAQIAAGIGLATMSKNPHLIAAGLGAATVGAAAVVGDLTDGVNGLGLLPPGGSPQYRIAGAGNGTDTEIKMS